MKEAENCWEFWNCLGSGGRRCGAYKLQLGRSCWIVGSSQCFKCTPDIKRDFISCFGCSWYKKLNANEDSAIENAAN